MAFSSKFALMVSSSSDGAPVSQQAVPASQRVVFGHQGVSGQQGVQQRVSFSSSLIPLSLKLD